MRGEIELQLEKWRFQCTTCGAEFHAFDVNASEDGVISARTESGEFAVLRWEDDPTWREAAGRVGSAIDSAGLGPLARTRGRHFILGRLLDPAPSGEPYSIDGPPPCPNGHGTAAVGVVGPTEPIQLRKSPVRLLSHSKWNSMGEAERGAFVAEGLSDYKAAEPEMRRRSVERAERAREWRSLKAAGSRPS